MKETKIYFLTFRPDKNLSYFYIFSSLIILIHANEKAIRVSWENDTWSYHLYYLYDLVHLPICQHSASATHREHSPRE